MAAEEPLTISLTPQHCREQLYKIGLPGKSILGYYFQENGTSRRPFLLLRIREDLFNTIGPCRSCCIVSHAFVSTASGLFGSYSGTLAIRSDRSFSATCDLRRSCSNIEPVHVSTCSCTVRPGYKVHGHARGHSQD